MTMYRCRDCAFTGYWADFCRTGDHDELECPCCAGLRVVVMRPGVTWYCAVCDGTFTGGPLHNCRNGVVRYAVPFRRPPVVEER